MMTYTRILFIALIISVITLTGSAIAQETSSSTGHEYELIEADGITWEEAREAASERTYNGKQGYLVTITSEEEQEVVESLAEDQRAWIGASDAAEEGTWRWVTGPEGQEDNGQGRHFFTQSEDGGAPVNGQYTDWNPGEPNAANAQEDHAQLWNESTTWNDNNGANGEGYIIEYGGLADSDDGTNSGDSDDGTNSGDSDDGTNSGDSDDGADSGSGKVKPSISFEPTSPEAGEQVAFSGFDSTVLNAEIINYNWKFGDGETATGETVSHTYSESGGYNVELTVITGQGNSYTTTEPISVEESVSEESGEDTTVEIPGFGFVITIVSLGTISYILNRRRK